jgi:hypothetical protein
LLVHPRRPDKLKRIIKKIVNKTLNNFKIKIKTKRRRKKRAKKKIKVKNSIDSVKNENKNLQTGGDASQTNITNKKKLSARNNLEVNCIKIINEAKSEMESKIKMLRRILNIHRRASVTLYGPEGETMGHSSYSCATLRQMAERGEPATFTIDTRNKMDNKKCHQHAMGALKGYRNGLPQGAETRIESITCPDTDLPSAARKDVFTVVMVPGRIGDDSRLVGACNQAILFTSSASSSQTSSADCTPVPTFNEPPARKNRADSGTMGTTSFGLIQSGLEKHNRDKDRLGSYQDRKIESREKEEGPRIVSGRRSKGSRKSSGGRSSTRWGPAAGQSKENGSPKRRSPELIGKRKQVGSAEKHQFISGTSANRLLSYSGSSSSSTPEVLSISTKKVISENLRLAKEDLADLKAQVRAEYKYWKQKPVGDELIQAPAPAPAPHLSKTKIIPHLPASYKIPKIKRSSTSSKTVRSQQDRFPRSIPKAPQEPAPCSSRKKIKLNFSSPAREPLDQRIERLSQPNAKW